MAKFRVPRPRFLAELVLVGLMMSMAPAATARHDYLDISVEAAKQYAGRESLLPMPFYMTGESHPKELESLGEMRTNKRTRAFGRSDEHSCSIVFQSAIIQLQKRANQLGANAVVDITTTTGGAVFENASSFRCAVGNIVANVTLTGRAVKLAK